MLLIRMPPLMLRLCSPGEDDVFVRLAVMVESNDIP